jgi:transcriptional regulator with XRE-family HTH domain
MRIDVRMMNCSAKKVINRILNLAKERNVSMKALASKAGCHVWTLKRWESGISEPLYCNVMKLRHALKELTRES